MIYRLRDRTNVPPKGFRWIDPETMLEIEARSFQNWISQAHEHRVANRLPLPDESRMENQLCGRMDERTRKHYCEAVDGNGTPQVIGVGGTLKSMLASIGISACFSCANLAKRMDDWGPDGCEEHMPEILEFMVENAKQRHWLAILPFKEQGAEWFVRAAIKRVREAQIDIVTETT